jgi:ubiquitin-protein ligase
LSICHVRQQHQSTIIDGSAKVSSSVAYADPRLMKEYRDLTADPLQDMITAGPISEDNMLEWEALVQGPEGTPYVSMAYYRADI